MSEYIIAGNWKMNTTLSEGKELAENIKNGFSKIKNKNVEMLLCPPFTHLSSVKDIVNKSGILVGAQDSYHQSNGAFTGEISNEILKSVGCEYVILGHSERRHILYETNVFLNMKIKSAIKSGLKVIYCVGETLEEWENGITKDIVQDQLFSGLLEVEEFKNITIAYEPVWAIGTGKVANKEQIEGMHSFIKEILNERFGDNDIKILYGGSLKPENCKDILSTKNVDGGLIGGASLKHKDFLEIYNSAAELIK